MRRDGVSGVASKCLAWLCRIFYEKGDYLVFEHDLRPTDFTPRAPNITVTAVCSAGDLERLSGAIRETLESAGRRLGSHLENGGMVFCVVIDGKLAHQSWVSTRLPSEVDPVASHLDYDRLAYIGACETVPEFRGQGLYPLVLSRICDALRSRGFSRGMLTVSPDNGSSISGITKAGFRPAGQGRLTRCLGRYSWIHQPPAGRKEH